MEDHRPMELVRDVAREASPSVPAIAFEDLFQTESVRLFRALCLVTRNRSLAEELTQEAFVRVYERGEGADHPPCLRTGPRSSARRYAPGASSAGKAGW